VAVKHTKVIPSVLGITYGKELSFEALEAVEYPQEMDWACEY
jgi:hypothetical protein